jgi:hypothetical protein
MTKSLLAAISLALFAVAPAFAYNTTTILKNQFGEVSINQNIGGTNDVGAQFTVDPANVNGLGISSLSGSGIASVYMHTSQTPATGNPNPASGVILINLSSKYAGFTKGFYQFQAPISGTTTAVTAGLTAGAAYTIAAVGTTTTAGWDTLGLLAGLTPAVGQGFVAATSSAGSGTGTVAPIVATGSGITDVEIVGNPSLMVSGTNGSQVILTALAATSSSVTTLVATAPIAKSILNIKMSFLALPTQLH